MNVQQGAKLTIEDAIAAVNSVVAKKRGEGHGVSATTRLDELGLSSLDIAEVLVALEEIVGYELDPESGTDFEVVSDLVRLEPL